MFCRGDYYGYLLKGDLTGAIRYIRQFPEQAELYNRFMTVFEEENDITYDVDACLNEILTLYQRYYLSLIHIFCGRLRPRHPDRQV